MTAFKAGDVERYVAKADPARPVVLVFGQDEGLVSERVEALLRASVDDPKDPFAVTRLSGDELAGDPARLADEALSIPMFGGRRAIWVRAGSRNFVAAVEGVLAAPLSECRVVIEAGDLKRNAPLRSLCERAPNAAALPCYADEQRDISRLIDDEMQAAGLAISSDARSALLPLLGGDRRASRNELKKLALFVHGRDTVTIDDVLMIVGDASGEALDAAVDAAFAGRPADVDLHFAKTREGGTSPGTIMAAALRQGAALHKLRLMVDQGTSTSEAVRNARINFRRGPSWEAALRRMTSAQVAAAFENLAAAAFRVRQQPALAESHAHRALIQVAVTASRR